MALEPDLASVLARARAGDLAAFEEILRRHERRVYAVALRLLGRPEDAQDAAQEVFFRLYKHLRRFDEEREFLPWLYKVTVNVCRDIGRRRERHARAPLEALEENSGAGNDPEWQAGQSERMRAIGKAIRRLPEKERAALVLRDLEGLDTSEVARLLGSSESTVRSQISAARLKLRKLLEGLGGRRP